LIASVVMIFIDCERSYDIYRCEMLTSCKVVTSKRVFRLYLSLLNEKTHILMYQIKKQVFYLIEMKTS